MKLGEQRLRDVDIRNALCEKLRKDHSLSRGTIILEEFGCNEARADLAVVNGSLHCFEIKSGADRLDRLKNQIPAFSAVFDKITLVVDSRHSEKAVSVSPEWWGIIEATRAGRRIRLRQTRPESGNPSLNGLALAKMLWRREAYRLLKQHNLHQGLKNALAKKMWQAISDGLPPTLIAEFLRSAITERGGSGFRKPLFQSGDSYPKPPNRRRSPENPHSPPARRSPRHRH